MHIRTLYFIDVSYVNDEDKHLKKDAPLQYNYLYINIITLIIHRWKKCSLKPEGIFEENKVKSPLK